MRNWLLATEQRPRLHEGLEFGQYFDSYDAIADGRVLVATYSFSDHKINFWDRLPANSKILVGHEGEGRRYADRLSRRYPWFEIRLVKNLHTKAILFENSRRLLIGSQNLFADKPKYTEVSVEVVLSSEELPEVRHHLFERHVGKLLIPHFKADDLKFWREPILRGSRPFLPCHREIAHWERVQVVPSFSMSGQDEDTPSLATYRHFLYGVELVRFKGRLYRSALDRGFHFCGSVSEAVVESLKRHFYFEPQADNKGRLGKYPDHHPLRASPEEIAVERFFFHDMRDPQKLDSAKFASWNTMEEQFRNGKK